MFNIFNNKVLGEPLFLSPLEPDTLIEWSEIDSTTLQQLYNTEELQEN